LDMISDWKCWVLSLVFINGSGFFWDNWVKP
jgi:hypothetical protein